MKRLEKNKYYRAFTMMEILIYLAVTALIVSVSLVSFASFAKREALDADATALAGGLREARAETLASVGGSQYGIYIATTTFTFFTGSTYNQSATTNRVVNFSPSVNASTTISTVVFERLTGNSTASGTISVYLKTDQSVKRTVSVGGTGLVNISK